MWTAEQRHSHYLKNKATMKAVKMRKARICQLKLAIYKWCHPCIRCEEPDTTCLAFHHLDPKAKEYSISRMASHGYQWDKIQKEIDKCQVMCHNCHSLIHYLLRYGYQTN